MEATFDTKPYLTPFNGLDVSVLECIYKDLGDMISRLKSPKKTKKPVREKSIDELIAQKEELTEEEKNYLCNVIITWINRQMNS